MARELRRVHNLSHLDPVSPFDLAGGEGIEVLFQELRGVEGLYLRRGHPLILVSALRPPGRQVYTCAHEIGHHLAGHGTSIDAIADNAGRRQLADEEFLVEVFAGYLLMPRRGVEQAFRKRAVGPDACSPEVIYTIATAFGVGYSALVHHIFWSLGLIDESRFRSLLKVTPKDVKSRLVGRPFTGGLVLVDDHWPERPVDLRVDDLILTSHARVADESVVRAEGYEGEGFVLRGRVPGVDKVELAGRPRVVRVSRRGYVGRAVNRFLEDPDFE